MSRFWNVKQTAEYLGLSEDTIYKWALAGKIPSRKHNSLRVFLREEIDAWSEASAQAAAEKKRPSVSKFEMARMRLRSLKTETIAIA